MGYANHGITQTQQHIFVRHRGNEQKYLSCRVEPLILNQQGIS